MCMCVYVRNLRASTRGFDGARPRVFGAATFLLMVGKNLLCQAGLYNFFDIIWCVPLFEFSGYVIMRRFGGKVVEVHEDHLLLR